MVFALDASSNVYITSSINPSSSVFLGTEQVDFPTQATDASLLIKYDPSGALLWYRILYATGSESITEWALVCDASNNVVLVGGYSDT